MTTLLSIAVPVALLVLVLRFIRSTKWIGVDEVRRLQRLGGVLVDIRSREAFTRAHIPNARNIPLDQLERRQHELGKGHVIVYSETGDQSALAVKLLRTAGRTAKIHDLGPMSRWKPAH